MQKYKKFRNPSLRLSRGYVFANEIHQFGCRHISLAKIPASPNFVFFQCKHLVSLHSDFESCFQ